MTREKERASQRPKESGMSMMEVMVSMAVMGVVLVGLGQGLTLGIRMNVESKARIANLSVAKRVMETVKSQVQFSQGVFDDSSDNDAFNRTFYVDPDGSDINQEQSTSQDVSSGTEGASPSSQVANTIVPDNSSYRVTVAVEDWADGSGDTLSAVDSDGVSHVLVKVLTVRVRTMQSAAMSNTENRAAAREVTMSVEMVRPAA